MKRRNGLCVWLASLMAVAVWPSIAAGQPVPSETRSPTVTTEVRTQLSASYNNPGLQQSVEWSKRRLTRPGSGPLTAWGQYAPLSILTLRIGVEPSQFFGTFDSLMSFDRQAAAFDNDTRRERGGAAAGRVLRVYATPTVRMRAGHLVALASGDLERWYSSAAGPWFYEPTRDTLLEASGSTVATSRAVVIYEHVTAAGTRLGLGGIHMFQEVDRRGLNQVQRLGGIATVQSDDHWHFLNRPTMNVIVARYLDDPSKDGGTFAAFTLRRR